jgi:hypothetical protein
MGGVRHFSLTSKRAMALDGTQDASRPQSALGHSVLQLDRLFDAVTFLLKRGNSNVQKHQTALQEAAHI